MNTFGEIFRLTSFGESHGPAVGGVIDGMPPGVKVDKNYLQSCLDRRRPGQSVLTTSRNEHDRLEILSGTFEGVTTGAPIGFIVRNEEQRSSDYNELSRLFRPSHADFTYQMKYGVRDYRGGGRSSARETVARVVAGGFAMLVLREYGVRITAYTSQVGDIILPGTYKDYDLTEIERNDVRCPDLETARLMAELIMRVKADGDTIGGVVSGVIEGLPVGLGEPVFDKLHARLGSAMLSINAAKGFDYGDGFSGLSMRGSEQNDLFQPAESLREVATATNHSGGIQGGISNGSPVTFRVAFKPVATLLQAQPTVDLEGKAVTVNARGRHDPCVLPRAVPIVEAMAAMVILDYLMLYNTRKC